MRMEGRKIRRIKILRLISKRIFFWIKFPFIFYLIHRNDNNEKYRLRQRKATAKYTDNNEEDEVTPEEAKIFKKKMNQKLKALMKEAELKEQEQLKPKVSFPKTIETPQPVPPEPEILNVERLKFSCFIDDSDELGNEIENEKESGRDKKEDKFIKKVERRGRKRKESTTTKKISKKIDNKSGRINTNKVESRRKKKKINEKVSRKNAVEPEKNNDLYMNSPRKEMNEETNNVDINCSRPNTRYF